MYLRNGVTMATTIIFLFLNFFLLMPTSLADIACPDPPNSAQLSFDLDALKSVQAEHTEMFQAPNQCAPGGHAGCEKQICCRGEVGCCYRDPISKKGQCGCRSDADPTCSPPPLAYIKGATCEPHSSTSISLCVRKEKAGTGWSSTRAIISTNSDLFPEKELRTESGEIDVSVGGVDVRIIGHYDDHYNMNQARKFLKKFTAEMLMEMLEPHVIAEVVALAKAKLSQELSSSFQ